MSEIDQIKDRLDIIDIIGNYVDLKKAGINHQARCPFHNEKTPSFYVSPDRQTFKCFGCGEGGDMFTFLQKIEGMTFPETLEKLAKQAGVTIEKKNYANQARKNDEKKNIYAAMEHAVLFWQKQLGQNKDAIDYLKKRGFTKDMVMKYKIGFAPNDWSQCHDYLVSKGFSLGDIETAGLAKPGKQNKLYDRFRSRIMFPLFDAQGRVVAVSGRIFGPETGNKEVAKYMNSPETPIFNKSKELYGFNFAKEPMRKNNFVLLVEGQFDLVMGQQVYPNTVATSGTSLSSNHLKTLRRFTDRIIFVFDTDNAGLNAAYKGALVALELDFEVRVAKLPEGLDPADVILESSEKFKTAISEAKEVFDFYLNYIITKIPEGRERTKKIEEKILGLIVSVSNPLEQDRYVKKLSESAGIDKKLLMERLASLKIKQERSYQTVPQPEEYVEMVADEHLDLVERQMRHIVGLLLWHELAPVLEKPYEGEIISTVFSDKEIMLEIESFKEKMTEQEIGDLLFEVENLYKETIITENIIQDTYNRLITIKAKKTLESLQSKLKTAELGGNTQETEQVKQEIARLITQK